MLGGKLANQRDGPFTPEKFYYIYCIGNFYQQ